VNEPVRVGGVPALVALVVPGQTGCGPLFVAHAATSNRNGTATCVPGYRGFKTPYKDHAGAVVQDEHAGALYVQLSADGLYVGGGYWHTQTDQAQRLRAAVADDLTGTQLQRILDGLEGWTLLGDRLKRLPRPYEPDHPRADLLHSKSLAAGLAFEPAEWLHEPECGDRVAQAWRQVTPLNDWLNATVGPTHREVPARR
jgi:uncharacterized protein (DUF2461 family)